LKRYRHPDLEDVALDSVMQALSDPCRISIVRRLLKARQAEMACKDIPLKVGKATRSHHFDVLREAGIIATRREGTKCMTSLRTRELNLYFPGLLKLLR